MESSTTTLAELQFLNALKHRVREITKLLDTSQTVYLGSLGGFQVKHEVSVLLSELRVHGLLPADVTLSQGGTRFSDDESRQKKKKGRRA